MRTLWTSSWLNRRRWALALALAMSLAGCEAASAPGASAPADQAAADVERILRAVEASRPESMMASDEPGAVDADGSIGVASKRSESSIGAPTPRGSTPSVLKASAPEDASRLAREQRMAWMELWESARGACARDDRSCESALTRMGSSMGSGFAPRVWSSAQGPRLALGARIPSPEACQWSALSLEADQWGISEAPQDASAWAPPIQVVELRDLGAADRADRAQRACAGSSGSWMWMIGAPLGRPSAASDPSGAAGLSPRADLDKVIR